MTKMAVLGKGSMKDKLKEQQLRNSPDPKHSHLQEDLHVEITAFSSPAEAHARVAYALSCVRKYMIPDSNDQIRQNQMREIQILKKLETSEDTASDAMAVSKDSGNESDASNSPPPNNSSPNSTNHSSLLLNNNSLPHTHSIQQSHPSHSHSYTSHSRSHPEPSHPHNHQNTSVSHSSPPPHHPQSSQSPHPPNYTSILNKVTIQRFTHEEEQVGANTTPQQTQQTRVYCCDQTKNVPNNQQKTNILDRILPPARTHNKRDHTVSMDYEYTHPEYFFTEEPAAKKCK